MDIYTYGNSQILIIHQPDYVNMGLYRANWHSVNSLVPSVSTIFLEELCALQKIRWIHAALMFCQAKCVL